MIVNAFHRLRDLFAPKVVARPLLNRSEKRLYAALCIALSELKRKDLNILTQVSYGEFLTSRHRGTFLSFNSKRADFVVADGDFDAVLVIEFQGRGHWGSNWISRFNAKRRDTIKRNVLRRAGLPLLEIHDGFSLRQVRDDLRARLRAGSSETRKPAASRNQPGSTQTLHLAGR